MGDFANRYWSWILVVVDYSSQGIRPHNAWKVKHQWSLTFQPCKSNFIVSKWSPETNTSWKIFVMQISVTWWLSNKRSIYAVEQCGGTMDNKTETFGTEGGMSRWFWLLTIHFSHSKAFTCFFSDFFYLGNLNIMYVSRAYFIRILTVG